MQEFTATQIATSVAGDGLAGGGGSALSVNVDDATIELNSENRIIDGGIDSDALASSIEVTSLTASDITVASLTVTSLTSSIVTSSVVKTQGSNIFGDASDDLHSFTGSIQLQTSGSAGNNKFKMVTSAGNDVVTMMNANSDTFPVGSITVMYGSNSGGQIVGNSNTLKLRGGIQ